MKRTTLSTIVLSLTLGIVVIAKSQSLEFALPILSDSSGYQGSAECMSLSADGKILVAGSNSVEVWLSKLNTDGSPMWSISMPMITNRHNPGDGTSTLNMCVDHQGYIYIAGTDFTGNIINGGGFVAEKAPCGKKKREYHWRPIFGV